MRLFLNTLSFTALFLLLGHSNFLAQTTFTVINTNNDGAGSLAQAITDANTSAGADIIDFNIPGDGPHTIALTAELPEITETVSILGYTQMGSAKATTNSIAILKIELDGTNTGEDKTGFIVSADNCRIEGLVINNFGWDGIYLGGSNNIVQGNHIGVSIDGSAPKGNGFRSTDEFVYDGIWIDNSSNNLIGGTLPGDRNVISCNGYSNIYIGGIASTNNKIQGNYIGPDATGTLRLANQTDGIDGYGGSGNLIGGIEAGAKNLISGNDFIGIYFDTEDGPSTIQGNFIGTDITGKAQLGNGSVGIGIITGTDFLIGGTEPGAGNLISGNGHDDETGGLGLISTSNNNIVQGNLIGTDITGTSAIPNFLYGVFLGESQNNLVGGSEENARNLLSGNTWMGILLSSSQENSIKGNIIGLDITGTKMLGNSESGIDLFASSSNIIGGKLPAERNIISGNGFEGIIIGSSESKNNKIMGNYIGVGINGNDIIPNTFDGIGIFAGSDNIIGGKELGEGNIIAGNGDTGVYIKEESSVSMLAKSGLTVSNTESTQTENLRISRKHREKQNRNVANFKNSNRTEDKLNKTASVESDSGYANSVLGNSIYGNFNLGIDLVDIDRGNDSDDGDIGANSGQNYPVISSVTGDGTNATINYLVNSSTTNSAYPLRVEFYVADTSGQGKIFLGSDVYTSDEASSSKNVIITPSISIGESELIVATATDDSGNTSEFSDPFETSSIVDVNEVEQLPTSFSLSQNYPNPFNPSTVIKYSIPTKINPGGVEGYSVQLNVYDVLGNQIATLVNSQHSAGNYSVEYNAFDLTSGIYFYTIKIGDFQETKKMILLK